MKFSIVVVSLNPGDKLKKTLQSILMQDFTDYEVIVKDGGSKDGCLERAAEELDDPRIHLYTEKDKSIYDGMNQAVSHAQGEYIYFLNCGDKFYDKKVLGKIAGEIAVVEKKEPGKRHIFYGDIFGEKNGVHITPAPKITGFTCYRNVPNHQSCFYSAALCKEKPFEIRFKIRGDYEHFLWCFYKAEADMVYIKTPIAYYEGGGYSESRENIARSKAEHREITAKYMSRKELFRYRAVMLLTLAPLRTFMAENPVLSGFYNRVRSLLYRR
ncbi:MAG: glycosyltransferase [Acetatifactor sp.]